MHHVIAISLRVCRINAGPLKCFGIEQHGVPATSLHDQRLVCADIIQIGFGDVFIILHPPCSHIELALRVLRNKLLDDFAVFGIVGQAHLAQVGLSDKAVSRQMTVTVRLKESGIDIVVAIIQHLRICACELLRLFCTADIGKYAILH